MRNLVFLALLLAAPVFGQDQAIDLRTAAGCGSAKTQFDVKVDKKQHAVTQPESGKALVYVIEEYKSDPHYHTFGHVTTRVGLDGNWVGATQDGAYVSFLVEPGVHRLCSDVQSILAWAQKLSGAAQLDVEAGKTYYYRIVLEDDDKRQPALRVKEADEPEGLLMLSKSAQSTWKEKK
jgi:hypothetical protein